MHLLPLAQARLWLQHLRDPDESVDSHRRGGLFPAALTSHARRISAAVALTNCCAKCTSADNTIIFSGCTEAGARHVQKQAARTAKATRWQAIR